MLLVALFIGVVLIVAAVRNSQGALFTALMQDVPAYVVWAAAIIALGAVGYVPGLKPVSRGLLMLVITVIVLRNYKNVLQGFESVWQTPPTPTPGTDTNAPASGSSGSGSNADTGIANGSFNPANSNLSPSSDLEGYESQQAALGNYDMSMQGMSHSTGPNRQS